MISQKTLEYLLSDDRVGSFGVLKISGIIAVTLVGEPQRSYTTEEELVKDLYVAKPKKSKIDNKTKDLKD